MKYEEVLSACKEWVRSVQTLYADRLTVSVDEDTEEEFFANIDTELHLGEISVTKPMCKPYSFVEFIIVDIIQEGQVPFFWYGDKEGDDVQEIINNLNRGIELMLDAAGKI